MPVGPPARLIDLTRLVSRVGRGPATGIDRVEVAYLDRLLVTSAPLFALVKTAPGYALLDRPGLSALADRLRGEVHWGAPDWIARLHRRQRPARRRAMSDLRRLSLAGCLPGGLSRMLRRHLPAGTAYINVGHSNLTSAVFAAVRNVPHAQISVMLHDTIPLDHPEFAAAGVPQDFARKIALISGSADLVLCNSHATEAAVTAHLSRHGRTPPTVTAHLGVTPPRPDRSGLPAGLELSRPWFVALGTIEPRKNHALLLDIWEAIARETPPDEIPQLFIVGARGWADRALLARLDNCPLTGGHIFELGPLDDGAAAALTEGARALLFPSLAEGYGLPPVEAAALGTPVVCGPLPVLREILGDYPVYAETADGYYWRDIILSLGGTHGAQRGPTGFSPPSWDSHFDTVLELT